MNQKSAKKDRNRARSTNVVQATVFSEKIAQLMNSYYNGLITNEEVIKELLKAAEEIQALKNEGILSSLIFHFRVQFLLTSARRHDDGRGRSTGRGASNDC